MKKYCKQNVVYHAGVSLPGSPSPESPCPCPDNGIIMASASTGPRALSARGQSDSWTKKKQQGVLRIFERFRNSSPEITELYPVGIASLDERTLTTMKGGIYEHFA